MTRSIVILGGGIAGLSVAYELTKLSSDLQITLIEQDKLGQACSEKAAGMLTPASEVQLKDKSFLNMVLSSVNHYSGFVRELTHNDPQKVGFQMRGSLMCALDADGLAELQRVAEFKMAMGLKVVELSQSELKTKEPAISHKLTGAFYAPDEGCVDNIALMKHLTQELQAAGVRILENTSAVSADIANETLVGLTLSSGETLKPNDVVLCTGLTHNIAGLHEAFPLPLRPVKGEALAIQLKSGIVNHPIQLYQRYAAYLVPRPNGELIVGATSEERSDTNTTAGAILDLLFAAWQVFPEIYEQPLLRTWAGLRPTTPDNYPVVGQTNLKNLSCLLGLYRKGIMLAPYLGGQLAKQLTDQETELDWQKFSFNRF